MERSSGARGAPAVQGSGRKGNCGAPAAFFWERRADFGLADGCSMTCSLLKGYIS